VIGCGGKVRITCAPENPYVLIGWRNTNESEVGSREREGFGGENVEEVSRHAESSGPKPGWYTHVK
jgi:hypothetical protein